MFWVLRLGFGVLSVGFGVPDFGFWVWGLGFGGLGSGSGPERLSPCMAAGTCPREPAFILLKRENSLLTSYWSESISSS